MSSSDVIERSSGTRNDERRRRGAKRLLDENDPKLVAELARPIFPRSATAESLLKTPRVGASVPDEEFEILHHLGEDLKNRFERAETKATARKRNALMFYAKFIAHDMKPFFDRIKEIRPPEKGPTRSSLSTRTKVL